VDAASDSARPMVRIAELEIDPEQLDAYKAILAEEREALVRLEPGVLMLHTVAIADNPTQFGCSRSTPAGTPMRRTSRHLTSSSTRPRPRRW
jgi:hypothetical protein